MTLKRDRSYMESDHQRSNCLDLLDASAATGRVFTCKTCQRQFSSFQALGGHRASHQKLPKFLPSSSSTATSSTTTSDDGPASPPKPKTHECTICGSEFPIGQALGGHMRRHRQQLADAAAREQRGRELSTEVLNFSILYDEVSAKLTKPIGSNLEKKPIGSNLEKKPICSNLEDDLDLDLSLTLSRN